MSSESGAIALAYSSRHLEAIRSMRNRMSMSVSMTLLFVECLSSIRYGMSGHVAHLWGMVLWACFWAATLFVIEVRTNHVIGCPPRLEEDGFYDCCGRFRSWKQVKAATVRDRVEMPLMRVLRLHLRRGGLIDLVFDPDLYNEYRLLAFAEERIKSSA